MTWDEFRNRCVATVQKIRDTKDDGVYAKLYADDVERLLVLIGELDHQRDLESTEAQHVWDECFSGEPG